MRRFIAVTALLSAPIVAAAGEITWSVENGFQQFKNAADFQKLKQAWKPDMTAEDFLSTQNSVSLRNLLPIDETWWDEATGVYNNKGLFSPTHNILLSYKGAASAQACHWSINGSSVGTAAPCTAVVTVSQVREGTPFTISVSVGNSPVEELKDQRIATKLILAVGDSFASGEGNPDHAAVTSKLPAPGSGMPNTTSVEGLSWFLAGNKSNRRFTESANWWDTACHRSLLSWQSLYALRKAVSDDHLVVRYASFSCSGAEAYDGFFRAQINPPVNLDDGRVQRGWNRDGGNIVIDQTVREEKRPRRTELVEDKSTKTVLNKSQLNAAIALLCDGHTKPGLSKSFRPQEKGLRSSPYYGEFKYDKCQGQLRQPDELLTSFGGNDFGFSGVVMWGLVPATAVGDVMTPKKVLATAGVGFFRNVLKVQDPIPAGKMATSETQDMYSDLAWAFTTALNTKPSAVRELVYPNPLPEKLSEVCSGRMTQGNEALSEFTNRSADKFWLTKGKFRNFIYRIEDKDARLITETFILPLQKAQRDAIAKVGWSTIESQRGFKSPDGDRTMCAVAKACDKSDGQCDAVDLPGWRKDEKEKHPSLQPIKNITEWEAYAPARMRALRMSNDSVLTQARFKEGLIQDDWISGSVHPVAQVHAGIADSIDANESIASE
ncbi:hypothetical protein [Pseudomonas sp. NFACC05-1]|uniref:hypothetical protein n=1 Tax=Pseudomonas sp. NFACC05-1 TaxID=1566241 RepID=UPI000871B0E0|nr:hypothetical protein [Pseudomonas sp. NFACC05-1]SCW75294.1 hypothetical protein SAMN03159424_02898 [Pseudomonas sp. NFACC05-1]